MLVPITWVSGGVRLARAAIGAVGIVEELAHGVSSLEKQAAAADIAKTIATVATPDLSMPVSNRPDVVNALHALIDAYVALENAIARECAAGKGAAQP